MQKWLANVRITLKPVVNDPPGLAIRDGLHNLGYTSVKAIRSGKYIQLYFSADDHAAAESVVDSMCRRLLANPVIEDYAFDVQEVEQFPVSEEDEA
ncbi:MAG: phosphoribosylformylglycinamidine synthase subunit PurS [Chloroflexota bacterium]